MYILNTVYFALKLTADGVLGFLGTLLGMIVTYRIATKQIRESEKPFIEFSLSQSEQPIIRNIGGRLAINVNIFKVFLDVEKPSKIYSLSNRFIKKLFPDRKLKMFNLLSMYVKRIFPVYRNANLTLEESLGTMPTNREIACSVFPISDALEIFVVQFENINGKSYQTVLKPTNGRGDFEKLYPPRRIFRKFESTQLLTNGGKKIRISRYLAKRF